MLFGDYPCDGRSRSRTRVSPVQTHMRVLSEGAFTVLDCQLPPHAVAPEFSGVERDNWVVLVEKHVAYSLQDVW